MKRVLVLAAVFLAVGASGAQASHLSYWDGRRAIVRYSRSPEGIGPQFSVMRCERQTASRVGCLLRWPHVRGGFDTDEEGIRHPTYTDYEGWTIALQERTCVRVWYVDFVKGLAHCL